MSATELKRLVLPSRITIPKIRDEDVKCLRAALERLGYVACPYDIAEAYEDYSEEKHSTSWMAFTPSDEAGDRIVQDLIADEYFLDDAI